jgi:hypothetical protein
MVDDGGAGLNTGVVADNDEGILFDEATFKQRRVMRMVMRMSQSRRRSTEYIVHNNLRIYAGDEVFHLEIEIGWRLEVFL